MFVLNKTMQRKISYAVITSDCSPLNETQELSDKLKNEDVVFDLLGWFCCSAILIVICSHVCVCWLLLPGFWVRADDKRGKEERRFGWVVRGFLVPG